MKNLYRTSPFAETRIVAKRKRLAQMMGDEEGLGLRHWLASTWMAEAWMLALRHHRLLLDRNTIPQTAKSAWMRYEGRREMRLTTALASGGSAVLLFPPVDR